MVSRLAALRWASEPQHTAQVLAATLLTASMKVYEIEPTQLLAGSNEDTPTNTSVNDWNEGGSLGAHEI